MMLAIKLRGNHYEMGYQHGILLRDEIHAIAKLRLGSCAEASWTGKTIAFENVISLADACLPYHRDYAPHLLDEWKGLADTTGLGLAEILIVNGFTDFADVIANSEYPAITSATRQTVLECTTFMVSPQRSAKGYPLIGQNWDLHRSLSPYVIMMRAYPKNAPAFMSLTLTGCIAMAGMNEHGISVCINNLADATGRPGVTWNMVVRKILEQDNIEDAVQCVLDAPLAGAHNYLIMDAHGQGVNIEAMSRHYWHSPLDDYIVHSNHCLDDSTAQYEQALSKQEQDDSHSRYQRAIQILSKTDTVSVQTLMDLTRNREDGVYSICAITAPEWDVETCGSIIMSPATRELWALQGLPLGQEFVRYSF